MCFVKIVLACYRVSFLSESLCIKTDIFQMNQETIFNNQKLLKKIHPSVKHCSLQTHREKSPLRDGGPDWPAEDSGFQLNGS